MTAEIIFDAINVTAALIVFGILFYKLIAMGGKFTWVERVGMGLIAAGAMMLIAPITFKPSPFDGWALSLFLVGNAVYLIGRMTFLSNYLSYGYAVPCSKKEYTNAFNKIVKLLS